MTESGLKASTSRWSGIILGILLVGWTLLCSGHYWRRPLETWFDVVLAYSPVAAALLAWAVYSRRQRWLPTLGRFSGLLLGGLLTGWTLYCQVNFWKWPLESWGDHLLAVSPVAAWLALAAAWTTRDRWLPAIRMMLESHTDDVDGLPDRHLGLWIGLAAGLGLFTELLIIRTHASYFQLFGYYKNVSLLSCFLGLGLGYMMGARRPLTTPLVLPLVAFQVALLYFLRFQDLALTLQNPVSEQLAFGIDGARSMVPLLSAYGFLCAVFALNALCFIPFGQLASRLMGRCDKLVAYGWNLAGSLAGIGAFYLLSFLWTPPQVWILVASLGTLAFLVHRVKSHLPSVVAVLLLMALLGVSFRSNQIDTFSPYQILTLLVERDKPPELRINNVYYQRIIVPEQPKADGGQGRGWKDHYNLPYLLKPAPDRVLIVGSGTGNDVAASVRNGSREIVAVEIDPAILQFGRELHPASPYQAANVKAVVDDARAFIRGTQERYDLIVYGLLDSHTLLSGMSGVRLDSYVYTVQAFREARDRLKDDGLICLTFSLIKPELGRKLYLMLQEAFDGQPPLAFKTEYDAGYTFLAGEGLSDRLPPDLDGLEDVTSEFSDPGIMADPSTDDWPFFYMPVRTFPATYVAMILVLLAVSGVFLRRFAPRSGGGWSTPCFFLGAGFMLVETKAITELALVYGSTWIVVGIVIASILLMAFLANLIVIRRGSLSPPITYGLLLTALVAGLTLSPVTSGLPIAWLGRLLTTALLTLPMFFSGFAFSSELRKSNSVAAALSSNLLGAMLGGFLEYNAMIFGYGSLYYLALFMYVLAFLGSVWKRA